MRPYLIGICGGSASGKTTILEALMAALPTEHVTLVAQDNYYKDLQHQVPDENGVVNFDHPSSVDLDLLETHIRTLLDGQPAHIREYHYNNPAKAHLHNIITYQPAPVVIVEGMFVFYSPSLRKLLDLKVFIEADEHIRLSRRILRDGTERGYPLEEVLMQYEKNVVPMYRRYVEPYKYDADIVLMNNINHSRGVKVLVGHIIGQMREQGILVGQPVL
jgi:uridine kinase